MLLSAEFVEKNGLKTPSNSAVDKTSGTVSLTVLTVGDVDMLLLPDEEVWPLPWLHPVTVKATKAPKVKSDSFFLIFSLLLAI